MEQFAKRLSEARKKAGMTQAEVAEELGVSFQAVSLWERGETNPDLDKLPEIAGLFGVSTDWLLMGRGSASVPERDDLTDRLFDEERMYTYIKTYAAMKGLEQTMRVLPYARELHKGQFRKGKDHVPYIYHPLLVACQALALGLDDDDVVSAALLHDVCEDCGVTPAELPVGPQVQEAVALLTKDYSQGEPDKETYFSAIAKNKIAVMVKLLDRCCNVSGMAAGFAREKMQEYIQETEQWFYPMIRSAKMDFPAYSNALFLIKYHISSVVETIKRLM